MRALSAAELLGVWEAGIVQSATERALTLLGAASPETSVDSLARLSIGQRDTLLFILRAWMFGSQLVGLAKCPSCSEQIELTFDTQTILSEYEPSQEEELTVSIDDCQVRFRIPTSSDLLALYDSSNSETVRDRLLNRCLLSVQRHGQPASASNISAATLDVVMDQMGRADPQGDIQVSLCCPYCKHEWQAILDVVSFLWAEVNAWAIRMLREVHSLAYAYGWGESNILGMSAVRRQVYLDLIGA